MELYVYLDENKQIREFLTLENTKRGTTAGGLYIIWKVKDYEDADTINDLVAQAEFQNLDHELIKDYRIVSNIKTLYFTESDLKGIDTKYFKANYEYKAQNGHCVRHIPAAEIPTDSALITENTVLCVISYLNTTENYEDSSVVIPFSVEYGTISSSVITKSEYQYLLGLIANNPNYLKVATGDRLINDLDLGNNKIINSGYDVINASDEIIIGSEQISLKLKGSELTYNGEELAKESSVISIYGRIGTLDNDLGNVQVDVNNLDNRVVAAEYALGGITGDVSNIKSLITTDTTLSNPLANQDFVNSSISTNTANFIGTFDNLETLKKEKGTPNDYAFYNSPSGFQRWKLTKNLQWVYEYTLNTTGLTEEQLVVLNSGITAEIVEHIVNDNEEQTITGKKTFKSESVRAYPIKVETTEATDGISFKNQYHTAHLVLAGYGFQFDGSLGVEGNITPIGNANIGASDNAWNDLYLKGKIDLSKPNAYNVSISSGNGYQFSINIEDAGYSFNTLNFSSLGKDIGSPDLEWKDLYLSGIAHIKTLKGYDSVSITDNWNNDIASFSNSGSHIAKLRITNAIQVPTETLENNVLSIKHTIQEDELGTLTTDISIVDGGVVDSFQAIVSFDIGDNVVSVSFPSEWVWREENNLVEDGLNANAHYVIALEKRSGKVFAKYDIYYV